MNGVLAGGAAARTSAGREYHRGRPGQQYRDILGRGRLQVADHRVGTGLLHLGGLGRVPDQPGHLIAPPGQEPLGQQRNLPVPTRDHYSHTPHPTYRRSSMAPGGGWHEGQRDDDPLARQRHIIAWHPLRALNAINVRVLGADLLTVHVQLSTAQAGHPGGPVPAVAVQPRTSVLTPAQK